MTMLQIIINVDFPNLEEFIFNYAIHSDDFPTSKEIRKIIGGDDYKLIERVTGEVSNLVKAKREELIQTRVRLTLEILDHETNSLDEHRFENISIDDVKIFPCDSPSMFDENPKVKEELLKLYPKGLDSLSIYSMKFD